MTFTPKHLLATGASLLALSTVSAQADIQHLDDVIITFSLCVGNDCVNGENFGFDTQRLKENNLRIHFDDTSNSASFPQNDWRIVANDSGNGGASYLAIEDSTAGRIPFRVEAGAPVNTLYVEADGDVGIKTANPVVDLHVVEGNTPTLRLEQDGSDGFTPQTYDVAANESNFFIRDVTNGSKLFFRSKPGAPEDSIFIAADGDIGLGTDAPGAPLEVRRSDSFVFMRLTATGANNDSADITYTGAGGAGELRYNIVDGDSQEMALDADGNLTIEGQLTTAGSCSIGCDRVFDEDYAMLSLQDHTDAMWTQGFLPNVGPTVEGNPFNVSDKMGRMLNELEHAHIYIAQLNERIAKLETMLAE